jgi:hypothetical protein
MPFEGEISGELCGRRSAIIDRAPAKARCRLLGKLGWAKTYDADYPALAQRLGCLLVTLDMKLRRGAQRPGFVEAGRAC